MVQIKFLQHVIFVMLFIFFSLPNFIYSQNLKISYQGETNPSEIQWTLEQGKYKVTQDIDIHPSIVQNLLNNESLSIELIGENGNVIIESPIKSLSSNHLKIQACLQVYPKLYFYPHLLCWF